MFRAVIVSALLFASGAWAQGVSAAELAGRLYRDANEGTVRAVERNLINGADVSAQLPRTLSTALMTAAQNGRADGAASLLARRGRHAVRRSLAQLLSGVVRQLWLTIR